MQKFFLLLALSLIALPALTRAPSVEDLLPIGEAFKLNADISTPGVVKLHWEIAPDYYLYRGQMQFRGQDGTQLGEARLPNGKKYRDEYLGDVETYHGSVDARIPYTLEADAQRIKITVRFQGCHDIEPKICYPPRTENLDLAAHDAADVAPATAAHVPAAPRTLISPVAGSASFEAAPAQGALDVSLLMALLLAFGGGLVLNLMPCVLPMLSIKAIQLLESGEDTGRAHRRALVYAAGVLCTFAAIGLAIVALRSAGHAFGWGAQLQQPLFVGMLVCVMVAVGLSMSGVVQFGTSLGNVGHGLASRSGMAGDFFTGVLAVAVASPCVAPFMGTALAYAFAAPMLAALLVFLALGLGLAAPFLLIGFVPAIGRLLPRPGAWMETLKQVLAFPMYLTAVWLVWVLAHQRGADAVGLVLIAAVLLAMTLWWFERSRSHGGWSRVVVGALALVTAVPLYCLTQLPANADRRGSQEGVIAYTPEKLAELRKTNTPVFIDMTADWCITCKANEHVVLDSRAFHDLLQRNGAVYMKGDYTDVSPVIETFLQRYHSPGVPLYVMFPKHGGAGKVLPNVLTASIVDQAVSDAAR